MSVIWFRGDPPTAGCTVEGCAAFDGCWPCRVIDRGKNRRIVLVYDLKQNEAKKN